MQIPFRLQLFSVSFLPVFLLQQVIQQGDLTPFKSLVQEIIVPALRKRTLIFGKSSLHRPHLREKHPQP